MNAERAATKPVRRVPCPGCRTLCDYAPSNPDRPFCSPRCKLGDLGAWAEERYRVEAAPPREDDDPADGASRGPT